MRVILGDCLADLKRRKTNSVDLVFTSPPYEDARTYGIAYSLKGDDWVQWCADRYVECCRVSEGLVAWVVAGTTKNYRWSAAPALLIAELVKRGVPLRNPAVYKRFGIPGSGGPDWLRSDYEWVICSTKGKLPWSDNTAMGHPPRYLPGGDPTNRLKNGDRVGRRGTDNSSTRRDGNKAGYRQPKLANPGNVIDCGAVGGGNIGSRLASENEAPFPEKLVEFFVKSFCPPGGVVLDPFCGSGTTLAVAKRLGRNAIGVDVRQSQVDLSLRRLAEK